MATASYLDRLLEPLTEAFTPKMALVLLELRADPELEAHIGELRRKANDGTLTPAEEAEYKDFVEAVDLISIMQAKARRFLAKQPAEHGPKPAGGCSKRAGNAREYCRMPQAATPLIPFHVEHIVSKQHGGTDDAGGLALACDRCNADKGPNLASIDPETRTLAVLFNPRRDAWSGHFVVRGGEILRLTATGRATVQLLKMNAPRRVELRAECQPDDDWRA